MTRSPRQAAVLLAVLALAGCTSAQDVLNPSAIAAGSSTTGTTSPADLAIAGASTSSPGTSLSAAVAQRTRLRFDPIVGATVEAATPLTERLAMQAKARGIQLAGSADPSATHVLKGYFSTMTEGAETTVIYVWDVYDPVGNRLHRISGQQKMPARGEGWASVPPSAMQAIADTTVEQLAGWLGATG